MYTIEKFILAVRHHRMLVRADWLWHRVHPWYNLLVRTVGRNGLERNVNGTDKLLVLPQFRSLTETYEPDLWRHLMSHVRPHDTIADVGAFIGLYTVALAKRVGSGGKIISCEPDPENCSNLKEHVALNRLTDRVEFVEAVLSDKEGFIPFVTGAGSQSHISSSLTERGLILRQTTLDRVLSGRRLDLLKIDVEGHEEAVLRGFRASLASKDSAPRVMYIEVHPYAWAANGTSDESLLSFLYKYGYRVTSVSGRPVDHIEEYGQIIAQKDVYG